MPDLPLNKTLDKFVAATAKSKVAIVVPLYGYWDDAELEQFNAETLKYTLDRAYSSVHQLYIFFVADPTRVPIPVANIVAGKIQGGNAIGVPVDSKANYADYIRAGFDAALKTQAEYIININPWVLIQHNGLDILVDRINRDDAKVVSGFDIKHVVDAPGFDQVTFQIPKEERNINLDLFGMKRYAAELMKFDTRFKTHAFLARDTWQLTFNQGFESISSQRIPMFSFEVDWTELEKVSDFDADKAYFLEKWHYDPGIKYE